MNRDAVPRPYPSPELLIERKTFSFININRGWLGAFFVTKKVLIIRETFILREVFALDIIHTKYLRTVACIVAVDKMFIKKIFAFLLKVCFYFHLANCNTYVTNIRHFLL